MPVCSLELKPESSRNEGSGSAVLTCFAHQSSHCVCCRLAEPFSALVESSQGEARPASSSYRGPSWWWWWWWWGGTRQFLTGERERWPRRLGHRCCHCGGRCEGRRSRCGCLLLLLQFAGHEEPDQAADDYERDEERHGIDAGRFRVLNEHEAGEDCAECRASPARDPLQDQERFLHAGKGTRTGARTHSGRNSRVGRPASPSNEARHAPARAGRSGSGPMKTTSSHDLHISSASVDSLGANESRGTRALARVALQSYAPAWRMVRHHIS